MPRPDQRHPDLQSGRGALLNLVALIEPTNADLLRALGALDAKIDSLLAIAAPRRSPLAIDPDEIARTMAMLQKARPIQKETPP